jgi:hypothetical protein
MRHIGIIEIGSTPNAEGMNMTTSIGGTAVRSGYYWNLGRWEVIPVEKDGGQLPGGRGDKFLRIPVLAVLMLLPMLGGLFVVFLPVIGFALTFYAAARPIVGLFKRSAEDLAATVTPGWAPGEAHLTGKRGEEKSEEHAGPPVADERLEKLSKEIEAKRSERS